MRAVAPWRGIQFLRRKTSLDFHQSLELVVFVFSAIGFILILAAAIVAVRIACVAKHFEGHHQGLVIHRLLAPLPGVKAPAFGDPQLLKLVVKGGKFRFVWIFGRPPTSQLSEAAVEVKFTRSAKSTPPFWMVRAIISKTISGRSDWTKL